MTFKHYDLEAKWAGAGALVFGRRARVMQSELTQLYQGHYESDSIAFSIAVWPLGEPDGGAVPALVGSGDLYHQLEDGQDRNGKFLTYSSKELRREEAGLGSYFGETNQRFTVDDAESRWWVVRSGEQPVAVYYGVAIKPGQVPSPLPPELEAFRAEGPHGKAHPRTLVGVRLADTGNARLVPVEVDDPRIAAAKRALGKALPKSKDQGFIVVPAEARESKAAPAPVPSPSPAAAPSAPAEAAFLSRLTQRFGPMESDDTSYFSGAMRGVVVRLPSPIWDVFEAWYAAPEFSFGDRAARYRMWRGPGVILAEVDIDTIDGDLASRWIGLIESGDRPLLLVLEKCDEATAKELMGIAAAAPAEHGETTLGHG